MAKKKKVPALRAMDKAFAIAANFPSKSPEKYKEYLDYFKQTKKETIEMLQMDSFWTVPQITKSVINFFRPDNIDVFIPRYRDLMLEFWRRNKKCYIFTDETISFINEKFRPEEMHLGAGVIFRFACMEPIYIEFPRHSFIRGILCGCTRMLNYETLLPFDENESVFVATAIFEDECSVVVLNLYGQSISEMVLKTGPSEENPFDMRLAYKAIAYLGYLQAKHDAKGLVITPFPRQGCESYQVNPIPYADWNPEYLDINSWMTAGFAPLFNFLSRANMQTELMKQISEAEDSLDATSPNKSSDYTIPLLQAILSWENYRVIYQYSKDTSDLLTQRHFSTLIQEGILSSRLRYMPDSSIVLYLKDVMAIILVTIVPSDVPCEKKLLLLMSYDGGDVIRAVSLDVPYKPKELTQTDELFLQACCTLIHLLESLEKNALKHKLKLQIQQGNPNTTSLAIIPPKSTPTPDIPKETPPPITLRQGAPIEEIPLNLFNITTKGIKRASRAETEKYTKWKMAPHTRRQHVHHYWVGTGTDRHLEARVLAPIKINYSNNTPPITTIREIK